MTVGVLFQTDPLAAAVAHSDGLAVGRGRAEHGTAKSRTTVEAGADLGGDSIALKKGLKKGPKKGPKVNLLQAYA